MTIDFASLFTVAGVSLVFGVGIVAVFSVGLLGLSMAEGSAAGEGAAGQGRPLGTALAGTCFLICAAAVAFGIWLIVPQFH